MSADRSLRPLLPLLIELNDLKRVRVANQSNSIATRLFRRAWARIVAGEDLDAVALHETAHAITAARLAGVDAAVLAAGGLDAATIQAVLQRSFNTVSSAIEPMHRARLRSALSTTPLAEPHDLPPFVELLTRQPRAGATRPDHPRVVLEPAEHHGDHCGMVAVYAGLLAAQFGAAPGLPFLCGLAHHVHNARLPDAGFAGDELLGDHLATLMHTFRDQTVAELPERLHGPVRSALALVYASDSPAAQTFQAADVFDRVLEMRWHAQSAAFRLDVALGEMDIVHPGPVQAFQQTLLRDAGLM